MVPLGLALPAGIAIVVGSGSGGRLPEVALRRAAAVLSLAFGALLLAEGLRG